MGVDLSFAEVDHARQGLQWLQACGDQTGYPAGFAVGDAGGLPFAANTFDVVVCSEVLEHLPNYERTLDEIARVLKPRGRFALSVPRYWPEALCWRLSEGYRSTPGGHVRIFKAAELAHAVTARGFAFQARHYAHGLHAPYWWLQCALWARREAHPWVRAYQRFLEWDILNRPRLTRWLARLADPVMGKSVVMYFQAQGRAA